MKTVFADKITGSKAGAARVALLVTGRSSSPLGEALTLPSPCLVPTRPGVHLLISSVLWRQPAPDRAPSLKCCRPTDPLTRPIQVGAGAFAVRSFVGAGHAPPRGSSRGRPGDFRIVGCNCALFVPLWRSRPAGRLYAVRAGSKPAWPPRLLPAPSGSPCSRREDLCRDPSPRDARELF
jgi:hypothetical protein